jgi:hypothetical protein
MPFNHFNISSEIASAVEETIVGETCFKMFVTGFEY